MKERLLAIYDLSSQPYSVGDMILFQGIVLALATHHQLPHVDMGFILNLSRRPIDPVFAKRINPDNAMHHLLKILPVIQFNPRLGSVFIWENDEDAHTFLQQNPYAGIWPELGNRQYYYYPAMHLWVDYYQIHGQIPYLCPPTALLQWAKNFYAQHSFPAVPITVNIRRNAGFGQDRNSALDVWLAFFDYCAGRYPVKFVTICGITEVDPRWRHLPNVVVAKDHQTNLAQDLTLISTAVAHLGTASGPTSIANLSKWRIPMAVFNVDARAQFPRLGEAIHQQGDYFYLTFTSPGQRLWMLPETLDLLIQEFERIWAAVDVQQWQSTRITNLAL